ncbi:hypothetical protein ACFL2Q_14195 [Thermodesulfobacteriota bacterium]
MAKPNNNDRDLSEKRQRAAFDFLADRARRTHYGGDGFVVNHVSMLALHKLRKLKENGKLHLRLGDVSWAMILPLYWAIDGMLLKSVSKTIKVFEELTPEEESLKSTLNHLLSLMYDPLSEIDRKSQTEEASPLHGLSEQQLKWMPRTLNTPQDARSKSENSTLVGLTLELIWHRDRSQSKWPELARKWKSASPAWLRQYIDETTDRLKAQANLIYPRVPFSVPKDYIDGVSVESLLYRGWDSYFKFELESLRGIVETLVPRMSFESPYFEAIWGLTQLDWDFDAPHDPQDIRVTRRRLKAYSGGASAFPSATRDQFAAWSAAVWRNKESADKQYPLRNALRLAQLNQRLALRSWDLFSWRMATQSLGQLLLDAASSESDPGPYALEGLRCVVQTNVFKPKEEVHEKAVSAIDFVQLEDRIRLVEDMVYLKPEQSFSVLHFFEKMSDAIPEDVLPLVARWSDDHVDFPRARNGLTVFPLEFWGDILPRCHNPARLCRILAPAVKKLAPDWRTWRADRKGMYTEFLGKAPEEMAHDVANRMLEVRSVGEHENDARWTILYNAALNKPSLAREFLADLKRTALTPEQRFHLRFLSEQKEDLNACRDEPPPKWVKKRLTQFADEIIERQPAYTIGLGPMMPESILRNVQWTEKDGRLVEQLIDAVNAPKAEHWEIVRALRYLAVIVGSGPSEYAKLVHPNILGWLDLYATERKQTMFEKARPERIDSFGPQAEDYIFKEVVFLAVETIVKRPDANHNKLAYWVTKRSFTSPLDACGEMLYLAVLLGLNKTGSLGTALLNTAQLLLMRSLQLDHSIPWDSAAGELSMYRLAELMSPDKPPDIFKAPNEEARELFLKTVKDTVLTLKRHGDPDIRAACARILRAWKQQAELPEPLGRVLDEFEQDARGRVRFAAIV